MVGKVTLRPTLLICLPGSSYSGQWVANWTLLFVYLSARFRAGTIPASASNIYLVRNSCVAAIRESDSPEYILWIDSDNIPTIDGFNHLFEAIQRPDIDLVGAWYPMQTSGSGPIPLAAGWTEGDRHVTYAEISPATDPMEVDYIGLGFALMKYDALRKLGPSPFRPRPRPAPRYFTMDDEGFCEALRESGARVWLHPKVYSGHLKLQCLPFD
jgi:hypothetical protein